jgi:hypothetical protein
MAAPTNAATSQKALANSEPSTHDPYVWSGRASQEKFIELAVAVLHQCIRPLIGASAPDHHGYQRTCDLISGQALSWPFGSPVFADAGKTEPPSQFDSLADLGGRISSVAPSLVRRPGWLPRMPDRAPIRSRRCVQVYWRAPRPRRCDAAASSLPRSMLLGHAAAKSLA